MSDAARIIESAVSDAFAGGALRPFEFGGSNGTSDVTNAVLQFIG
jgi:isocitrate/isopropylmalate dehydrogenase